MSKLHCLLLVHGDGIEDLCRNIASAAGNVGKLYAIMGDRANEIGPNVEFQMVDAEYMKDFVDEMCSQCPGGGILDAGRMWLSRLTNKLCLVWMAQS